MQGRRSILLLAASALPLFFLGQLLLPGDADTQQARYEPREEGYQKEAAAGYRGAFEYYRDLREGVTPEKMRKTRKAVQNFSNPSGRSLDLTWKSQGPVNQGGRTRSILLFENSAQMWVGSVSGGIWRSYDGGETWDPISAFNQECVVSSMAQTGDGTLFVGTGNRAENPNGTGASGFLGRGLFMSTDNGGSFSLVPGTMPDTNNSSSNWAYINEVVADPNNNSAVYIANGAGLKHYDASTGTMTTIGGGGNIYGEIQGLVVSSDGSHLLASNTNGQAFLSTDGGNSWTVLSGANNPLPSGGRAEVAIAPSDKDVMYVSFCSSGFNSSLKGVFMSKDGGNNWCEIAGQGSGSFKPFYNGLSYQGTYDQAIAVDPDDPGRLVLGGITLWEFTNHPTQFNPCAGQWSKLATSNGFPNTVPFYVHADIHEFEWKNGTELYVGTDGGVFHSDDDLESFLPASKGYVATQFYSVEFSPDDQIMGGTQDNGTQFLSRENQWAYADEVRGGDGFACEISQIDPSVLFATTYGSFSGGISHYIQRSENGGGNMSNFFNSTDFGSLQGADFYSDIRLFEDMNDTTSKDSVEYINTRSDSSTIYQGDSLTFESLTLGKEVTTTLKVDSLPFGDTVKVNDPVQSLFAFVARDNNDFVYVTRDALRLTKSSQACHKVLALGGRTVNTYAFSGDGNYLWVGMRNGEVYRISDLDSAYSQSAFQNKVSSQQVLSSPGLICTDISVDENDPDHVVASFGGYGGSNKIKQSFDAASANPTWSSIWDAGSTNLTANLANMPVYSVLIERDDPNIILAGTEYGVFATDDGGSTWIHQTDEGLDNVPVFAIEQQKLSWHQGAKNPGHIYLGTHGRGLFKTDDLEDIPPRKKAHGDISEKNASLNIYPNPASQKAFLKLSELPDQELRVALYDLKGRKVRNIGTERIKGSEELRLDVDGLEEGIYIVRAYAPDFERTAKLVISR